MDNIGHLCIEITYRTAGSHTGECFTQ